MSSVQIPVDRNSPDQKFSIDLEGTVYVLRLIWNSRTGRWALSIFEEDETPIITGIAVVGNFDLLKQYSDPRLPPGTIYVADQSGLAREPTDENLGGSVLLLYADAAEVASANAEADEALA